MLSTTTKQTTCGLSVHNYQNLVRDLTPPVLGAMMKIGVLNDQSFSSLAFAKVRKSLPYLVWCFAIFGLVFCHIWFGVLPYWFGV